MAMSKSSSPRAKARELHDKFSNLLLDHCDIDPHIIPESKWDSLIGKVETLLTGYTSEELQEAVLLKERRSNWLLLHNACVYKAPIQVVRLLLDNDRERKSIIHENTWGRLPIHCAVKEKNGANSQLPSSPLQTEVVRLLLDSDKPNLSLMVRDIDGYLPIHHACENAAPLELIQILVEKQKKSIFEKDRGGWLPIHHALWNGASVQVIRFLLDNDTEKTNLHEKEENGRLPIHLACSRLAPLVVVKLLLENDEEKTSIFEEDNGGKLPIHHAAFRGASARVMQLLLEYDNGNQSLFRKTNLGSLPIQEAIEGDAPINSIRFLLRVMLGGRIQQLGLQRWREGVEQLIDIMSEDDEWGEKSRKMQQIFQRLWTYEKMERVSLLELGIWKISCLNWGLNFSSMEEMQATIHTQAGDFFDPAQYKEDHRINGGSGKILPLVVPFLDSSDETLPNLFVPNDNHDEFSDYNYSDQGGASDSERSDDEDPYL